MVCQRHLLYQSSPSFGLAQQCPVQLPNSNQTIVLPAALTCKGYTICDCCAGLYLSFLVAVCVLAVLVSVVCMATRLPRYTSLLVPIRTALIPQAPVSSAAIPVLAQPISDRAAEALRQTDENLKKRIITLAIKVRPVLSCVASACEAVLLQ